MGGSSGRPRPRWRPVRMVCTKSCALQRPRPVSGSGVRLAVKLTPQGPAQAVFVADETTCQGPGGSAGTGGMARRSGGGGGGVMWGGGVESRPPGGGEGVAAAFVGAARRGAGRQRALQGLGGQ